VALTESSVNTFYEHIQKNELSIKDLDIVIVNFNSTKHLLQCVKSIKSHLKGISANIIVHDNASTDDPDSISKKNADIFYIKNYRNCGFSRAINRSIKFSKSQYILLLNPDTMICDGFFDRSLKFLSDNKQVGLMGPKVLEKDGSVQGSARTFPTPLTTFFGRKSPITRLFPNNPITKKNILTIGHDGISTLQVDWVSGACMLMRRDAFESVEGFDENFFLYWEDTDLCKRMKDKGWNIVYYPKAQIIHYTGISSNKKPLFSIFQFHRSCYYLFRKHCRWPMAIFLPFAFLGLSVRCLVVMMVYLKKHDR
jgi:GT2 family glycosyltransferase